MFITRYGEEIGVQQYGEQFQLCREFARKTYEAECQTERVVVRVSDPGVGYDSTVVLPSSRRRLGLISLRERLSYIGGTVELRSSVGSGTVAVLTAPLSGVEPRQLEQDT